MAQNFTDFFFPLGELTPVKTMGQAYFSVSVKNSSLQRTHLTEDNFQQDFFRMRLIHEGLIPEL